MVKMINIFVNKANFYTDSKIFSSMSSKSSVVDSTKKIEHIIYSIS